MKKLLITTVLVFAWMYSLNASDGGSIRIRVNGTNYTQYTVCYNSAPIQMINTGNGNCFWGSNDYQWQIKTESSSWTDITGANSSSYTHLSPLTVTTYFRRRNLCPDKANSNTVTIFVASQFNSGGTISQNQEICHNTRPANIASQTLPSGGIGSYTYQWQQSVDNSNWTNISGATSTGYHPNNLTQTTYYRRSAINQCGTQNSNMVTITVKGAFNAGSISGTQTICYNVRPSTLGQVTAPSGGFGNYVYQWEQSHNNIAWLSVSGATSQSYTPTNNLTQTTYFRRKVTETTCNTTGYSNVITVTVNPDFNAGSISGDQTICYDTKPAQIVQISGATGGAGNYAYQWEKKESMTSWTEIVGAISQSYTPPSNLLQTTDYRRKVTDQSCGIKYSNIITVTVRADLQPGSISGTQTVCYNTKPSPLTQLSAPSGGSGTYSYQWERSVDNSAWTVISGATLQNYTSNSNLTQTTYFRRKITDQSCGVKYSNVITVTVRSDLSPGSISGAQTICYNTKPSQFIQLTAASGGTGNYVYQWEHNTDNNSEWLPIPNATTQNYTSANNLTQTTKFRRRVTDQSCGAKYSNEITVQVYDNLTGGQLFYDQTICYNTQPSMLIGATNLGSSGNYSYQWEQSNNGSTWNAATGGGSSSALADFLPGLLTQTRYYQRKVTDNVCNVTKVSDNIITITVRDDLQPGSVAGTQTVCYDTRPAQIIETQQPMGCYDNKDIQYQWEYSIDDETNINNMSWILLFDKQSFFPYYSPRQLTQTTYFKRRVTSLETGSISYSNTDYNHNMVKITVYDEFSPGKITTSNQSICYGESLLLTGSEPSGSGNYSYQWEQSHNEKDWCDIASATAQNYQTPELTQNTYYRRKVTDITCGCQEYSTYEKQENTILITVKAKLNPGIISDNQTVCHNAAPIQLTGTLPTGGGENYVYLWEKSVDNIIWEGISASNSQNYQPPALTQETHFRRKVTETVCNVTDYTNEITIYVRNSLTAGEIGIEQTLCYGETPSLLRQTEAATGGTGNYSYQWEKSANGVFFDEIPEANSIIYQPSLMTETTHFRRKVTDNECLSYTYSNVILITVRQEFTPGYITENQTICYNTRPSQLSGTAASGGGGGNYSYQWQLSADVEDWFDIPGATSANYNPSSNLHNTTHYRRKVSDNSCGEKYSNVITVTVRPDFSPGAISDEQQICYNTQPAQLISTAATGAGGNYSYQWQHSTNGTTWNDIPLATHHNYTPPALTHMTHYRRKVTESTCNISDNSNVVTVYVLENLYAGEIGSSQTVCYGTSPFILYPVNQQSGGSGNYIYQWEQSSDGIFYNEIPGANDIIYQPENLTVTTHFRRKVIDEECLSSVYSNTVIITVGAELLPGAISGTQTVCYNGIPAQLTGTIATGGTGSYFYQWEQSVDEIIYEEIPFANSVNYQPDNLTETTHFRRAIIDLSCEFTDYSNEITVTVMPQLESGAISATGAQTICHNDIPAILTGTASEGGSGDYSYQWELRLDNSTWTPIENAVSQNYQPGALSANTHFRRIATDNLCSNSVISNTLTIAVRNELTGGEITGIQTVCYGTVPNILNQYMSADGGTGNYLYQWEQSIDEITFSEIYNANTVVYQPSALNETTYFRRKVTEQAAGQTPVQIQLP